MRVGVFYFNPDYGIGIGELARELETRGFASLYVPEHTHIPTSRRTPFPHGGKIHQTESYAHIRNRCEWATEFSSLLKNSDRIVMKAEKGSERDCSRIFLASLIKNQGHANPASTGPYQESDSITGGGKNATHSTVAGPFNEKR